MSRESYIGSADRFSCGLRLNFYQEEKNQKRALKKVDLIVFIIRSADSLNFWKCCIDDLRSLWCSYGALLWLDKRSSYCSIILSRLLDSITQEYSLSGVRLVNIQARYWLSSPYLNIFDVELCLNTLETSLAYLHFAMGARHLAESRG